MQFDLVGMVNKLQSEGARVLFSVLAGAKRTALNGIRGIPTLVRALVGPSARQAVARERHRVSANYFESIRNLHAGKRGFIIGNGPSLKMKDLDRLQGEVSIASNLIYLAFGKTGWRPTYVTVVDNLVWEKLASDAHRYYRAVVIQDTLDPERAKCVTYQFKSLGRAISVDDRVAFSSNAAEGLYGGSTVTYTNLQLARHLGLNPVYLIGCDHYYSEPRDAKEMQAIENGSCNHFSSEYRVEGEMVNPAPIENMTRAYQVAQRYCEQGDFRVYNVTRGGHLEVFPRCGFDDLFADGG